MSHMKHRLAAALFAAMLLASLASSSVAAHRPSGPIRDLFRAAVATARFHSLDQATKAGYGPFPDGVPLHECISSLDDTGAMGFHWVNGPLLTPELDPTKPEVLVYAPDRRGNLHLAALEYVVFKADWDAIHDDPPELFGQEFMDSGFPNRYEIPEFYALHVWLWKWNPTDLFAPFNPNVSCDPGGHSASRASTALASAYHIRAAPVMWLIWCHRHAWSCSYQESRRGGTGPGRSPHAANSEGCDPAERGSCRAGARPRCWPGSSGR